MLNRKKGIEDLERLLNNELEFLTPDMLLAFTSEKGADIINERFIKKGEDSDLYRIGFIQKKLLKNDWIEYSVEFNYGVSKIGYVHRKSGKFIVIDGSSHGSLYSGIRDNIRAYSDEIIEHEVKLNNFEVLSTTRIRENLKTLIENYVYDFSMQYQKELIDKLDDNDINCAKKEFLENFVLNNSFGWTDEEIKRRILVEIPTGDSPYFNVSGVMNSDLLFEYVLSPAVFELNIAATLQSWAFDGGNEWSVSRIAKWLYIKKEQKALLEHYSNQYNYQLYRTIHKCLKGGGKTVRVTTRASYEQKVENMTHYRSEINEFGRYPDVRMDEVMKISFGKNVLFDREAFDKEYGHLKSND